MVEGFRAQIESDPLRYGEHEITLSATFGMAEWPSDGLDGDQLYRCADHRLYRGKHLGRNQLVFHDVLPADLIRADTRPSLSSDHSRE